MRYLHENSILVSITYPNNTALPKGLYTYRVRERNEHDRDDDDCRIVFVGNFYANGLERYHSFNIAEIVRNDVEVFARDANASYTNNVRLITTYWLELYTGSAWVSSSDIDIAHIYQYPNYKAQNQNYLGVSSVFFDLNSTTQYNTTVALQGFNRWSGTNGKSCALLPRYPLYEDEQDMDYTEFPFGITIEHGVSVQDLELRAIDSYDGDLDSPINTVTFDHLGYEYFTATYKTDMGNIVGHYDSRYVGDIEIWLYNAYLTGTTQFSKVAVFEKCYSRYYLFWQDRFGSYQCQPFSEVVDYSEDIDVNEIQNYMNIRRRGNVSVQPKWRISSGWISSSLYPYYESLYVSPILKLLDTKYDHSYDVIFKDNYVEKTYKNQKKLLNITLDLEQTYKQNILY